MREPASSVWLIWCHCEHNGIMQEAVGGSWPENSQGSFVVATADASVYFDGGSYRHHGR
jgi:hypothetical protein